MPAQEFIAQRQELVDAEHEAAEILMAGLDDVANREHPNAHSVFVPSRVLPQLFWSALGQRARVQAASRQLHQFIAEGRMPRLTVSASHKRRRGFVWTARDAVGKAPQVLWIAGAKAVGLSALIMRCATMFFCGGGGHFPLGIVPFAVPHLSACLKVFYGTNQHQGDTSPSKLPKELGHKLCMRRV